MTTHNYNITNRNSDLIFQWVKQGWSAYKIAQELECSKTSVLSFLKKNNIKTKHPPTSNPSDLLKDKISLIKQLYNEGHTIRDVGRIVGHSHGQIGNLLKKHGCVLRDQRYKVKEDFFDSVDTPDKEWALDIFRKYGYIYPSYVRLVVKHNQKDILDRVIQLLGFTGPISTLGDNLYVSIYRKNLAQKLMYWGNNELGS